MCFCEESYSKNPKFAIVILVSKAKENPVFWTARAPYGGAPNRRESGRSLTLPVVWFSTEKGLHPIGSRMDGQLAIRLLAPYIAAHFPRFPMLKRQP
jgi:hypothetical protein